MRSRGGGAHSRGRHRRNVRLPLNQCRLPLQTGGDTLTLALDTKEAAEEWHTAFQEAIELQAQRKLRCGGSRASASCHSRSSLLHCIPCPIRLQPQLQQQRPPVQQPALPPSLPPASNCPFHSRATAAAAATTAACAAARPSTCFSLLAFIP